MCTPNTKITFCSCVEDDIYENKDIYIWSLYEYLGAKEQKIKGKIMMPIEDFLNGISAKNVIKMLHEGNVFDFDYQPKERDTLHICYNAKNRNEYKYFSLIFIDKSWKEGSNPYFASSEKKIASGKIQVIYKYENLFLKHCNDIKVNYGIAIPESIKVRCANLNEDSMDSYFLALKNLKVYRVFFNSEFIEYVIEKFFNTYIDEKKSDRLHFMINEAQSNFSVLEKKFKSEKLDLSFINGCFSDFKKNIDNCLYVAIFIEKDKFFIINGNLSNSIVLKSKQRTTYYLRKDLRIKCETVELFYEY